MHLFIKTILLFLTISITAVQIACEQVPQPLKTDNKATQIRAVHYFSSSWPKSFWGDFERSQVDHDFAQIKADGFNTIILVIPWRGFEIGFEDGFPEPSLLYDRFEWLLTKIEKAGLSYGLRISFPHNFDPANGISINQLCTNVFIDSAIRENWLQYLARVTQLVDRHRDTFKFAFFSWEDFFCPYASFTNMGQDQRLKIARISGYQTWLEKQFPMLLVELLYQRPFNSIKSVPVPERESPAFWLFLGFVDQFLIDQLIKPGRQILPELAMEVRVDKDPIQSGDNTFWAGHDLALSDSQLRGSYWGAYYGARNQGELLTASEALKHFENMLNEVSDQGRNINHIVEQFNFADNTPGFVGHHAQIDDKELSTFLEGAADLLKQKSRGYGLWAYRDYVDSAIYNSSFELGLRGWDSQGGVTLFKNTDGDQALQMPEGSEISQTFAPFDRFAGLGASEQLTFCANFERPSVPAQVKLLLNSMLLASLNVSEKAQYCVAMDTQPFKQFEVVFSITSDVEIQIDDLRLYSFTQILNVYDKDGQPGPLRDLIVLMNTDWLVR